jgi:2-iminobutanoate/2-iminopropanoate deaminase
MSGAGGMAHAAISAERIYHGAVEEPAPGLWSNCKRVGNQVFIAGLVALRDGRVVAEGDALSQACFIFENIRRYMEAAGGCIDDVVKVTIFITSMKDRAAILEARRRFFSGDFPCSTLVAVSALIDPGLLVEIEAVGFVGSARS